MNLILLGLFSAVAQAAPAKDEITALPGWKGTLPSKQYSGYLNVSDTKLHYWLVESENNPADAPTILWFNGKIYPFIIIAIHFSSSNSF